VWALLFLCAFGLTPLSAVLAIALPYSGTLAKIVSEMLEEAPRDSALLLKQSGASALHSVLLGLVPRVIPDIVSYSLYRFECSLRAAAVMGFIGIETLGLHLHHSFEVSHYHEVWTYLLVLLLMVALLDRWSTAIRRHLPA
jgi:phosphonate transport system permease protein